MRNNKPFPLLTLLFLIAWGCKKEGPENNPITNKPEQAIESSLSFKDSVITIQNAIQSKEGGYVLVGAFRNRDLIMKIDESGYRKWLTVMDETNSPYGLQRIFYDNNQLVAYRTERYGSTEVEMPVLKSFNEEGKLMDKFYIHQHILGYDILKEDDGYVVLGDNNYFTVQKISKQGAVLWTEKHANSSGLSISKLEDGNYITIGGAQSDTPGEDFLFKLDKAGKRIWSKPIRGYRVLALPDKGFVALAGHVNNQLGLLRFDGEGNQLWNYQPGTAVRDLYLPTANTWLFHYGVDKFVYCVRKLQEVQITVIDNKGNLFKTISVPFKQTNTGEVKAVSIIKTSDDGLFITYDTKNWVDSRFDGMINVLKIPSSKILTN